MNPRRKNRTPITIGLLLLLIIIAGGGIYLYHQQERNREKLAYEILENNDNPTDYEDFLSRYPNSDHASEVRRRLQRLEAMLSAWSRIALSSDVNDFLRFKQNFDDVRHSRLCDIKIDSLDFLRAQREGTPEAFARYLTAHPDGQYASEASVAQGTLRDQEITPEDRNLIMNVIADFFRGFSNRDEVLICSKITATMKQFLHQNDVTKTQVVETINAMYNEHIQSCQFIVSPDIEIKRIPDSGTFTATFTVDQHIRRDNDGKTLGVYSATAEITPQLLITSLQLKELSSNN